MKLRKIIRYLEIIDRQLEILYINLSKQFDVTSEYSLFWKKMSLEKRDLYSCLSLVEQVGEENLVITEYKEEEFICVMEKLTRYVRESFEGKLSIEEAIEVSVEVEGEHFVKIINQLSQLVDGDFRQVVREMNHDKQSRNNLRQFIVDHYPQGDKKQKLIERIEKSFH